MRKFLLTAISIMTFSQFALAGKADTVRVKLATNYGDIVLELYPDKAPLTVKNFLRYVDEGFYNNTLFHRVIKNFMIQGGGYTPDYQQKTTHGAIKNESNNGLKNTRGAISMARLPEPHTASSQFFINVKDNDYLNFTSATPGGWGYTVFGKVVEGMTVADEISKSPTGPAGPFATDAPQGAIIIKLAEKMAVTANVKPQKDKTND